MQIAKHGADHHGAQFLLAGAHLGQKRLDDVQPGLHGAGRDHHLGHKYLLGLEAGAHFLHGLDHVAVDYLLGVGVVVQGRLHQPGDLLALALAYCFLDGFQIGHGFLLKK